MNPISIRKTLIASSVALALGAPGAEAALVTNVLGANTWFTDSANFTYLSTNGGNVGQGTNDVVMHWDGNAYNSSSDYTGVGSVANVTMSSTAPFFGHSWLAHDIQVFVPGSYSFDVTLGGGNTETGTLNATVGSGQLGMHLLWDWNGNNNIDVFVVLAQNSVFGSGLLYSTELTCASNYTGTITKNCLYDGPHYGSAGAPVKNQVWMLAATDGNGDGIVGIPMAVNGPLAGDNINFNATLTPSPKPVPVPAAVWLFGSGLMGLVAAAGRRKKSRTA
jgi:hypothetical protein